MSNTAVADRVDSVTAKRRVVRVDVLAPKGEAAGATAHVNLVIDRGRAARTDQIRGRVLLTRSKSGWRVFGFDIERGRGDRADARSVSDAGRGPAAPQRSCWRVVLAARGAGRAQRSGVADDVTW